MRFLVLIFLCFLLTTAHSQLLNICSFNVQRFDVSKVSTPEIAEVLVKIFRRYDLCLIQEIVYYSSNSSSSAIYSLLDKINADLKPNDQYDLVLSDRLGNSSNYKEQYGFFYKNSTISLLGSVQYYDVFNYFERPPFSIVVQPKNAIDNNHTLFITGIHVKPERKITPSEIDHLVDVYDSLLTNNSIPQEWRDTLAKRWLLMGDLNAGRSYVSAANWATIRLRNQTIVWSLTGQIISRFQFLINDTTGTTTSTNQPYDRFVATPALTSTYALSGDVHVVAGSPKPFNFASAYGLSLGFAECVSDHFPIELQIANFFDLNDNLRLAKLLVLIVFISFMIVCAIAICVLFACYKARASRKRDKSTVDNKELDSVSLTTEIRTSFL